METLNIVLSIVASLLSIFATAQAYKSKREIKRLRDLYEGNVQKAYGNGNSQVMGTGNRVVGCGDR